MNCYYTDSLTVLPVIMDPVLEVKGKSTKVEQYNNDHARVKSTKTDKCYLLKGIHYAYPVLFKY